MIDNTIKADLVQLNGYYQYVPKLVASADIADEVPFASVIRSVLGTRTVPEIRTTPQMAEAWGLSPSEVFSAAEHLRKLGYEIRNHSTNPQIEEGCWLVPYIFPTLTPLSVQLWKNL